MALQAHLELKAGPDRMFNAAVCSLWVVAAIALYSQITVLPLPIVLAGIGVLLLLRPGLVHSAQESPQVQLYLDGTATSEGSSGTWGQYSWSCRWFTVLRIDGLTTPRSGRQGPTGESSVHVLFAASTNHSSDYRQLLVWARFPPNGENSSHKLPPRP